MKANEELLTGDDFGSDADKIIFPSELLDELEDLANATALDPKADNINSLLPGEDGD